MKAGASCKVCGDHAVGDAPGGEGPLCETHLKTYYQNRWNPTVNDWEAFMYFSFECLPDIFEPKYRYCSFHEESWKAWAYAVNKSTSNLDACFALFGHRGISKTTATTACCANVTANNLKKFGIYRADNVTKAEQNFIGRLKFFMETPKFVWAYGNLVPARFETGFINTAGLVITKNKLMSKWIAMGIEQSSRSMVDKWGRPDVIIEDDIAKAENELSDDAVDKLDNKVNKEDIPALDPVRGCLFMHQTPVTDNGLYWRTMADPSFKIVERPLFKRDEFGEDLRDAYGNKIPEWPERYPPEYCKTLERKYSIDATKRRMLYNEYYLKRRPPEDKMISPDQIQFAEFEYKHESGLNWVKITHVNGEFVQNPLWEAASILIAGDPATSESARACDTAIIVLITLRGLRRFIGQFTRGQLRCRDVVSNPKEMKLYDVCLDTKHIEKRGIVGEMYRQINYWHPDTLVIETKDEYENTIREIEYSYEHWYKKQKNHHEFRWIGYKPGSSEGPKRARIFNQIHDETDQKRLHLRGTKKEIRADDGRLIDYDIPMKDLYDQILNIDESTKIDGADVLHIALKYSEEPPEIETQEDNGRKARHEIEEEQDFVTQVHAGLF